MTRFNKILIGVFAAQLVLLVIMLSRGEPTAPTKPTLLLAGFDASKVEKVTVWGERDSANPPAAGAAATDKPSIELVKGASGWVVASHFNFPAKEATVTDLMSKIATLKVGAPVATGAARQTQLAVTAEKFQRKVVIHAGSKDTTIWLGGSVGRGTALRVNDDKRVYGVAGLTPWGIGAGVLQWIDTAYLDIPKEEISKVLIARGADTIELVKGEGADWQVLQGGIVVVPGAGEKVDTAEIERRIGLISKVHLTDPADPARDASKPTATISVWKKAVAAADPAAGATPLAADPSAAAATPGTSPAPGATSTATTANANALPAFVIDVIADADATKPFWVKERGKTTAISLDTSRLKDLVELTRAAVVKVPAPEPKPSPTPTTPAGLPEGLPPGILPN